MLTGLITEAGAPSLDNTGFESGCGAGDLRQSSQAFIRERQGMKLLVFSGYIGIGGTGKNSAPFVLARAPALQCQRGSMDF